MAIGKVRTTQVSQFVLRRREGDFSSFGTGGSTTSTTPIDINTLSFTPASTSDYLIASYLSVRTGDIVRTFSPRLYDNNTATAYNDRPCYNRNTTHYVPWCAMKVLTGLSGSQTFKSQIASTTLNTAYWNNNFLIALNLSNFPSYEYIESLGISTTSSTTFVDKVTLTPTLVPGDAYLLFANMTYRKGVNLGYCEARTVIDDRILSFSIESGLVAGGDATSHHTMRVIRSKIASPTIRLQYRTQSTANCATMDALIIVIRLNDTASLQINGNMSLLGNARLR